MKNLIGPMILTVAMTLVARAQGPKQSSGTYITHKNSARYASETYSIVQRPGGIVEAQADIDVPGQPRVKVMTRVTADKPVSFSEETGGARLYLAEYGPSGLKLQIPGRPDLEARSRASVVLENLVWHQYIMLLGQYDGSKGGRQDFIASLPSAAKDLAISVERRDNPSFTVAGQQVKTEHYQLKTFASLQIEIWSDLSHIPLLLLIDSQGLKVIRQGSEGLAEAILAPRDAESAQPAGGISSEDITIKSGDVSLAGTLSIPQDGVSRHPAIVIISGSGPQDRDGNPHGFSMFKRIAEQLSSHGIAVLRHDDRGVAKSSVPARSITYRDLIDDTKAAVAYLRGRADIDPDRIGLVGHSEGGFTAAIIAAEDPKISAIGLMAGAALGNFESLLNEQVLYDLALQRSIDPADHSLEQPMVAMLRRQIREAKEGQPDTRMTDGHEYFRQHLALDMADIYRRVHCPVLILQGERDSNVLALHAVQVSLKLSELGNRNVRLRIIPDVDHGFVPAPLDKCATDEQRTRISQDFLNTLQKWATAVLVAKKADRPYWQFHFAASLRLKLRRARMTPPVPSRMQGWTRAHRGG